VKCPVCETRTIDHWIRGFVVGILLGSLIAFIAGQLFHSWEYSKFAISRIEKLQEKNSELKQGYVPPRR
jgi:hypothetical protein